jgi:hypothetical protein
VKVGTPFGEYPFVYRRVERRPDGLAVIGTVAGIESTVVLDRDDAKRAAKALAVPATALALLLLARSRRASRSHLENT